MKTLTSLIISLALAVSAFDQTYTIYNSDGSITTIVPDNRGGAVIYEGNGGISFVTPPYHAIIPDPRDNYKAVSNRDREALGLPPIP